MRILITGASGFVGRNLCKYLNKIGHDVFAFSRISCDFPLAITFIQGKSILKSFSKSSSFNDIDCVIHLAGITYKKNRKVIESYSEYLKINVEETLNFAKLCEEGNVKRFIFLSSIKVNGESTIEGKPFNERDIPNPQDYYALSKYEAEKGLLKIAKNSNMEITIVRPPLIYGCGAKGYFGTILKLIKLRLPLPFGLFNKNKRSFIYLENLLKFIEILVNHPKAGNEIFLCSDDDDISTADLFKELSYGMYKESLILKVPRFLFLFFFLIGKGHLPKKLNESLVIDNSKSANLLGWNPPYSTKNALKKVSKEYLNYKKNI